jgi:hypothetical protein
MMPTGTAEVDFGAFPGKTDASLEITGQTGILADSPVEVWLLPSATVEHSADEHWVEEMVVVAGNVVAGTGFTAYARTNSHARLYGRYKIGWVWI